MLFSRRLSGIRCLSAVLMVSAMGALAPAQWATIDNMNVSPRVASANTSDTFDLVATGVDTVGVGKTVYLGPNPTADAATSITDYFWSVVTEPSAGAAAVDLDTSSVFKFRPTAAGRYEISLTPYDLGYNPTTTTMISLWAASYLGATNVVPGLHCATCHSSAGPGPNRFDLWSGTKHASKLTRDLNGENGGFYRTSCLNCHSAGSFADTRGDGNFFEVAEDIGFDLNQIPLWVADAFTSGVPHWDDLPAELQNVGNIQCESCHGPGNTHNGDKTKITVPNYNARVCRTCHDAPTHHMRPYEWDNSAHSTTNMVAGGRVQSGSCVRCHTAEGFTEVQVRGKDEIDPGLTTRNPLTCLGCHDPHDATNEHQLRKIDAVTLPNGLVYDRSLGNLCVNCHNSRVADGNDRALTSRSGVHHGPQSDMFLGSTAHDFGTFYPVGSSVHYQVVAEGCVQCHMAEGDHNAAPPRVGGHTWRIHDDDTGTSTVATACAGCHPGLETTDRIPAGVPRDYDGNGVAQGIQSEVRGLMEILKAKLLLLPGTSWNADTPKIDIGSSDWALLTDGEKGALYNLNYISEDKSFGVHNAPYTIAMLQRSYLHLTGTVFNVAYPAAFMVDDEGVTPPPPPGVPALIAVNTAQNLSSPAAAEWASVTGVSVQTHGNPAHGGHGGHGGGTLPTIDVKAAYSDTQVFLRFEWDDPTESNRNRMLTYNQGSWSTSGDEDRLFVAWPIVDGPGRAGATFAEAGCAVMCHQRDPANGNTLTPDTTTPLSDCSACHQGADDPGADFVHTEPAVDSTCTLCHADPHDQISPNHADMIAAAGSAFDIWHWKAQRSNPLGIAEDQHSSDASRRSSDGGNPAPDNRTDGKATYVYVSGATAVSNTSSLLFRNQIPAMLAANTLAQWNAGASRYELSDGTPVTVPDGTQVTRHIHEDGALTDASANVLANGSYSGGKWSLVLTRNLMAAGESSSPRTLSDTDYAFDLNAINYFAMAVTDNSGIDHKGVALLSLQLGTPPPTDCETRHGCFVDQQYRDFLERESEPAGHQFYVDHLCSGTMSQEMVVRNFIASPEFADFNGFVARCYFSLFNDNSATTHGSPTYRVPDFDGQNFWRNVMEQTIAGGGTTTDAKMAVVLGFMGSPEWQDRIGTLTDAEFVEFLYTFILGRPSEPEGYAFQLARLQDQGITRQQLAAGFIDSPEAVQKYWNHTYVGMSYLGMLNRGVEKSGFDFHMARLENGEVDIVTFLLGFIYSPEYINRLAGLGCTFPTP